MAGGGGGGSSQSSSQPQDVTPEAFKRLQQPFADVVAQLLGFAPTTGATAPSGGGAGGATSTGGTSGTASGGQFFRDSLTGQIIQSAFGTAGQGDNSFDPSLNPRFVPISGVPGATGAGGTGTGTGTGGINFPGGSEFTAVGDPNNVLRGIPTTQGPFAAGLGGNEATLLSQLLGEAGQGTFGLSEAVLGTTAAGGFLQDNPFLQQAIEAAQRPTLQGLEEVLSRTLPGRFTQAGQFTQPEGSSAFDRAAAIATRGVADSLSDIAGQLSFAGFEAERGRQQEAAALLPQVTETEVNTLIKNLQAQALPRLIEQAGIEGGIEAFNNQVNRLIQVLGLAQGTSAPVIAQTQTSSSKTKPTFSILS